MNKTAAWFLSLPVFIGSVSSTMANEENHATSLWDELDIALGVETSFEPDYAGSNDYEVDVLPVLQITYKDWLYLDSLAVGAIWRLPHGFRLQTGVSFEEGRESNDNDALDGLDDIRDTAVLDAGLFYDIGDLTLGLALEQDLLGRGKGLVTFLGARYNFEFLDDRLEISPQVDLSIANGRHLRTEFGITPEEAVNSQFDAYRPGAGIKSFGFATNLDFELTDHWSILGEAGVEFYGSEATDSPLLDEAGADFGAEVEIALTYKF